MATALLAILIGAIVGVLLVLAGSAIMNVRDKQAKQKASATPNSSPQTVGDTPTTSFAKRHGCLLQIMLIAAVAGGMIGWIVSVALTNPVVAKDALIGGAILGGIGLLLTFFLAAIVSFEYGAFWMHFLAYSLIWIALLILGVILGGLWGIIASALAGT